MVLFMRERTLEEDQRVAVDQMSSDRDIRRGAYGVTW